MIHKVNAIVQTKFDGVC